MNLVYGDSTISHRLTALVIMYVMHMLDGCFLPWKLLKLVETSLEPICN